MKEKIKKLIKWLLNNWRIFMEIGVIFWAINGMWQVITYHFPKKYLSENGVKFSTTLIGKGINILLPELLFYFLSTALILYLLKKYDRKT